MDYGLWDDAEVEGQWVGFAPLFDWFWVMTGWGDSGVGWLEIGTKRTRKERIAIVFKRINLIKIRSFW